MATNFFPRSSRSGNPSSMANGATKLKELAVGARPIAPNIGRGRMGWGVGMDALASPICA